MNNQSENKCRIKKIDNKLIFERRDKLKKIRDTEEAYPNKFIPTHRIKQIYDEYKDFTKEDLALKNKFVKIAGRIMLKRIMGKASFMNIQDEFGRIQIYVDKRILGNIEYDKFKSFDIGDIIYVEGEIFKTNKLELSIRAKLVRILSKSIRPLPDKFHGISDQELRYRQRYVDLIMNREIKNIFVIRSKAISYIRQIMHQENFLEVETPMLQTIPGGATAKPFITHHNSLNMDMFLRIAPELYLKRLIVGGFERIFELNRNFRNEGVSTRHNPEFTMMEFYAAYTDYVWMMDFTENLIKSLSEKILGTKYIKYQNNFLDLEKPFDRLTISQAIVKYSDSYSNENIFDISFLRKEITSLDPDLNSQSIEKFDLFTLQLMLFEKKVEEKIWSPTFIIDYPIEISPLARSSSNKPGIAERFELFIAGRELANGFSELNDPEDQALRLKLQAEAKQAGDEEKMFFDSDYIRALEYGMPPTGGCGIGIDRLIMLLTDSVNIRDVIFFPHLRPE